VVIEGKRKRRARKSAQQAHEVGFNESFVKMKPSGFIVPQGYRNPIGPLCGIKSCKYLPNYFTITRLFKIRLPQIVRYMGQVIEAFVERTQTSLVFALGVLNFGDPVDQGLTALVVAGASCDHGHLPTALNFHKDLETDLRPHTAADYALITSWNFLLSLLSRKWQF
jgi:hypothetical protein